MKISNIEEKNEIQQPIPSIPILKYPEDLPFYRKLGRTDLNVSCLGIGGGGSISSEDTLYAFDKGINYFFYSSDLHHNIYSPMSNALKTLCGRGSSHRDKVVLATVTYLKGGEVTPAALIDQFMELGIDYIDVFFWGWIGRGDTAYFTDSMNTSRDLRGPNSLYQRVVEKVVGCTELMKKMGIVRYVGASFHDVEYAREWINSPLLDVVMIRHNVAHRNAQELVLKHLSATDPDRPGIVTFKSAGMLSPLWQSPHGLPDNCWQPSVPDFYRYSLSQNCVDVALMGPEKRSHIDAALAGLEKGKLSDKEIDYLNLYGDLHRQRLSKQNLPSDRLIHR
jgi:aryl-alcohol dehydrogenase-like predicted oxidoreductase